MYQYLRNEFEFWKDHGIMNTTGLLQSKRSPKGFTLTLQENIPKIEFIILFTFYYINI